MGLNVDRHQGVARFAPAETGMTLPSQPQHLAVVQPGWDGNVERLAVGHGHPFLGTRHRLREGHGHRVGGIGASGSDPGAALAEDLGEQVFLALRRASLPAALVLEAGAGLGMLAVELAFGSLALGAGCVYLTVVETRALLLVAHDVIGRGDLLEARFRTFIVGIEVRVVFLGESAVGLADFLLRRRAADTQDFVRVHHRWVLGQLPGG